MMALVVCALMFVGALQVSDAEADDAVALPPPEARYRAAVTMLGEGDAAGSIQYFKSCEAELRGMWEFHLHYGMALMSASSQAIVVDGRKEAVVRSSHERMRYLRNALIQFRLAEAAAPTDELKAMCIASQAKLLAWVGSPLDAIERYRRAVELSSEYAEALARAIITVADPCSGSTVVNK